MKKNPGRKEQHIKKPAPWSPQRGKMKCLKSCFAWAAATLNAASHHPDGHCKSVNLDIVNLQNIILGEALDPLAKPKFPSGGQGAAGSVTPQSTGKGSEMGLEMTFQDVTNCPWGTKEAGTGEKVRRIKKKISFVFSNQLKRIHFASTNTTSLSVESVSFSCFLFWMQKNPTQP